MEILPFSVGFEGFLMEQNGSKIKEKLTMSTKIQSKHDKFLFCSHDFDKIGKNVISEGRIAVQICENLFEK